MPAQLDEQVHHQIICSNVFIRKGDKFLLIRRSASKRYAPGIVHPVGGKVNQDENPYEAAKREALEETGLSVRDLRLEAVLLDIKPVLDEPYNWLVYHFSGEPDSGSMHETDEGELVWLTREELLKQSLHPSIQPIIDKILDGSVGTIFVTNQYDEARKSVQVSTTAVCGQ